MVVTNMLAGSSASINGAAAWASPTDTA